MPRLLRQLRAVLWSFVGVRQGAHSARDLEGAHPATLVLLAVIVAGMLVAGLFTMVRLVVGDRATTPQAVAGTEQPQLEGAGPAPRGPVRVPDTMEERMRACTTCHGSATEAIPDGFSPRIAGKPAGYLFNQLVSFREQRRTYAPMVHLVQYMPDDYLRDIARYFAELVLPYPPPESHRLDAATLARAQGLIERGDAARGVPACIECHGASLAGLQPAIPGLLGLPRDYMNAQFGAWRNGRLRSLAPDCMAEVAQRLAPEDVPALSAWLASRPVPAGLRAEQGGRRLPLECGVVKATAR